MQAAVDVAHEHGFVAAELRATTNLGATTPRPEQAFRALTTAEALAARLGHRTMAVWAATTAREIQVWMGRDWQAALEEALAANEQGREQGWLSDLDECRNLAVIALVQIARGQPADAAIARLAEVAATLTDPAAARARWTVEAERAFALGKYAVALDAIANLSDLASQQLGLPLAIRSAAYLGDVTRARSLLETFEELPFGDPPTIAARNGARGMVAALEGRMADASGAFREAITAFLDLSMDWEAARTAVDMTRLVGPRDKYVSESATRARTTFEQLGAVPYLALLDAALADAGARSGAGKGAGTTPLPETAGA